MLVEAVSRYTAHYELENLWNWTLLKMLSWQFLRKVLNASWQMLLFKKLGKIARVLFSLNHLLTLWYLLVESYFMIFTMWYLLAESHFMSPLQFVIIFFLKKTGKSWVLFILQSLPFLHPFSRRFIKNNLMLNI